jgi:hypothetical protein
VRTAVPAISPVRMLLIFVRIPPLAGGRGAGGAEPLAEAGGSVLVAPAGAFGSVMALLPSSGNRGRWRPEPVPSTALGGGRRRRLIPGACFQPILETRN